MANAPEFDPFTPYKPLFLVRNRHNKELIEKVSSMTEEEWGQYVADHENAEKLKESGVSE